MFRHLTGALLLLAASLVPAAEPKYPPMPPGMSPKESLAAIRVRAGFAAELVASEPLVMDPIDIAWGPDGRLWVVEMADYPLGLDGKGKPGGRIRVLEDTDGDGKYDKSTVFLEPIAYPTGVMPWRKGVIITAAPAVLYAEDTDGDGKADVVRPLFSGFAEGNQQHRVNGPRWGLDNWVYLANGDSGGRVKSVKTGKEVDIRGRDLRVRPDDGAMDLQTGQAQYGRNRDDWGDWFGCNNSRPLWHYVLNDSDLRRNPFLIPPRPTREVPEIPGAAPVYPISRTLARFNDLHTANRFTSACSSNVYRDDLFGPLYTGNVFTCEPVHNLVSRLVLTPDGVTFTGKRAHGEEKSEFLASSDNWFRPTAVHTGPDGALYVVDMYRQVIEHPQWIPADWQKELDLRAGHDKGRIYRVAPVGAARRPIPRLDKLTTAELVAALDTTSGWQRDMVQMMLVWKADQAAVEPLRQIAKSCQVSAARMQALCTLDGIGALTADDVRRGLADSHPGVRRHAVRLARGLLADVAVADALLARIDDPDPKVRLELACALGDLPEAKAGPAIARMALAARGDEYILAAVFSSLSANNVGPALTTLLADEKSLSVAAAAVEGLFRMAAALGDEATLTRAAEAIGMPPAGPPPPWKMAALAGLLDGLDTRPAASRPKLEPVAAWLDTARKIAVNEEAGEADRVAAIRLLPRKGNAGRDAVPVYAELLGPRNPPAVQEAALAAVVRIGSPEAADGLLAGWKAMSPRLRGRVVDAMVSRDAWADRLVRAVEGGKVPVGHIDATARQRLTRHNNPFIRARADKLFASGTSPDRAKVIEEYLKAMPAKGDPNNGRQVFRKTCAACHRLEDQGHAVGPDLMTTTDKPADWFLTAILDPNRAVEDRYVEYQARTADGRTISGLLAAETGVGITLRAAEGKEETISRRDLEALVSTGRSPMPDGLEKDVSPQAMADLLAYIAGLRPKPPGGR
jgi:putative membrane-bound dehydrogenase-like protein